MIARINRKKLIADLPEVFLTSTALSPTLTRAVRAGEVRRLTARLFTKNMTDLPEEIVRRNLWQALGFLFPGTIISHRTALEHRPAHDGTVFLTGSYDRRVELPGMHVVLVRGPGPLAGDMPFVQSLWYASRARAFLESLRPSRTRKGVARGVPRREIEARLERMLLTAGASELNALRDQARAIAAPLGADSEQRVLDDIIGTLLSTRDADLSAPVAMARAAGAPYDSERLALLQMLHSAVSEWSPVPRPDPLHTADFRHVAFWDAYFSNYIEGTEFEIEEAERIVFDRVVIPTRSKDSHDVLGTFDLVSSRGEMGMSVAGLANAAAFSDLLRHRHASIMGGRPEVMPGVFKTARNRAGDTVFVEPELVPGTLAKGFEMMQALPSPFARAVFMAFLVSEVHPFADGNGRLSRAMMNAELIAGGERRILVPIVYRDDYLGALRRLSRHADPQVLVRMFDRAQAYAAAVDCTDLDASRRLLEQSNAFRRPDEGRLRLPGAWAG